MPNNSGIFSLSGYNDKNLEGLIPDKTRESFREYGYFGGGFPARSTVDRIDYSNDTQTAIVRNPLTIARHYLTATGNSNFGYFSGGIFFPGPIIHSIVERIDYSNDNSTTSPRGPLSIERFSSSATGNQNFGYFGGGNITSIVDRIDYSNDNSTASVRGPLLQGRQYSAATGNSNFGYFGGGVVSNVFTSTLDRIDYFNDTAKTSIRGSLNRPGLRITRLAATGNSNFGYFGGGWTPAPVTIVDRIDYSNDTAQASVRGSLSSSRYGLTATGNSNFGYFCGGVVNAPFASRSTVDRIDYSNDTITASVRGPLSSARGYISATSSHNFGGSPISQYGVFAKPFGYFGGGRVPANVSTIERIDYSNDTQTPSTRSPLNSALTNLSAAGNASFGYFGGGGTSKIDRLDYSNDNSSLLSKGTLSTLKNSASATGNSNFGYFGGGFFPGPNTSLSTVDRIDYSNDSTTASIRGPLSLSRFVLAATGNQNFGYFGGGAPPVSTIDRIDYSNDNSTALNRNNLPFQIYSLAATGNQNFGYFSAGYAGPILSTVYRIDYASDTTALSTRGPLTIERRDLSATGNQNFGYFAGGNPQPGTPIYSTIDRVDYANDTATATARGPLTSARRYLAATSPTAFGGATDFQPTQTFFDIQSMKRIEDTTNASVKKRALGSFGYFGGGQSVSARSIVDRINYSNDLATASVRGPLAFSRYQFYAIGNLNFGYFGGGYAPGQIASIDRIDYSNDSSTASFRNNLSTARFAHAGTSNNNFGYFGGGYVPGIQTNVVNRINFSNDLSALLIRGPLSLARKYLASTGNNDFGYYGAGGIGGGGNQPATTTIDRINYANDLSTASVRNFLSTTRRILAASGNQNFGYFSGGLIGGGGATVLTVERINYSSDLSSLSIRGPLSSARSYICATGNDNFGFVSGSASKVDRIDYANDTATASVRGPLSLARTAPAATTNARTS